MELLDQLCREMIAYNKGDPRRIHHFLKVHAFAEQIGREEGIPEKQLFVWKRPLMSMISGFIGAKWSSAGMMERYRRNWGRGKHALYWKDSDSRRKILTASAGWPPIIIPTGV